MESNITNIMSFREKRKKWKDSIETKQDGLYFTLPSKKHWEKGAPEGEIHMIIGNDMRRKTQEKKNQKNGEIQLIDISK